jgi:outer membrane receptor protein involved in Fe transport
VAASAFFKDFDQPIERIVEYTAQLRTSFANAESARNFGFELEARRQVGERLLLGGNYTFVDSKITLTSAQAQALTSLERPLAGTSKNAVNAFVELRALPVTARLLYNFVGERIADVGAAGLPDIFEDGRGTVDLAVSSRLGRFFTIQFAAENLNNEPITFLQGGQPHREYTLGRAFSVKLAVSAQ